MPIVTCPGCGRRIDVPASYIGTRLKCSECSTSWTAQAAELSSRDEGERFQEAGRALAVALDVIGWLIVVGGGILALFSLYLMARMGPPGLINLVSAAGTILTGYVILRIGPYLEYGARFAMALARERAQSPADGSEPPTNVA